MMMMQSTPTPSEIAAQRARHISERSQRRFIVDRWSVDARVEKYQEQFSFLRDSRFLQDLENDSVDSDLIEEELKALRESAISTREKVVKFLQSNPVQILLCVIVLLDAGIVIAQILLDLNSVKEKLQRRDIQMLNMVDFVRFHHNDRMRGYAGDDVDRILRLLNDYDAENDPAQGLLDKSFQPRHTQQQHSSLVSSQPPPPSVAFHLPSDVTTTPTSGPPRSAGNDVSPSGGADGENHRDTSRRYRPRGGTDEGGSGRKLTPLEDDSSMHSLAHGLHFASIAMLGLLVLEDLIKIIAMGKTFCRHKIEIVDAIIIGSSFAIDIIFLGGVSGEEGQKAAAVLVVLLLWRIARVVDGIVVTVKQRQEFRIRLQKRARRAAERKLETFMEEQSAKTKQIEALKDLCLKAGINDADIAACAPHHTGPISSTLCALSSVARLSVSMTMLMSSGAHRQRLLADGLASSSSRGGTSGQGSRTIFHPTADIDYMPGGPTPPPPKGHHLQSQYRHLWRSSAKRGVAGSSGGGVQGGLMRRSGGSGMMTGGAPPRIESLPNMHDDSSTPETAASVRRKFYSNARGNRKPQQPPYLHSSSLQGRVRCAGGTGGSASNDAMTTEESSTSCGEEDSSDGPVFDVIREESIRRPTRGGQQQNQQPQPQPHQTTDDDTPTGQTSDTATQRSPESLRSAAVASDTSSTPKASPVNSTGVRIIIDSDDHIAAAITAAPTGSAGGSGNGASNAVVACRLPPAATNGNDTNDIRTFPSSTTDSTGSAYAPNNSVKTSNVECRIPTSGCPPRGNSQTFLLDEMT